MNTNNINIFTPTMKDIDRIVLFLSEYVENGILLYRSKDEIASSINSYILIEVDNQIIASAFLEIYNSNLCEIRSLLVDKNYRRQGLAKKIILRLIDNAVNIGLSKVIVLTYMREIFDSLDFIELDKKELPYEKVWKDCLRCKFFPKCEEILLIKNL